MEHAARDLQTHPAVIATRAALAEATGSIDAALGVVTTALQQQGVDPGAKKVPRGADQDAAHWLLQRLAGLQLQVSPRTHSMQWPVSLTVSCYDSCCATAGLIKTVEHPPHNVKHRSLLQLQSFAGRPTPCPLP